MTEKLPDTINGVPSDRWGTWCPHGIRIVEPDPDSPDIHYPNGRVVDPWPCADGCTREAFEAEQQAEYAAYHEGLMAEYWGSL